VNKRLPPDAFNFYVALGSERSHKLVADHFDVHKRTVTRTADRENWNERLAAVEKEARENSDKQLAKDLGDQRLRHRKMLTAMASRAARALQEYPLTSGMEGIKAAELVIKLERLLSGEATERTSLDIEQVVRREYQDFMIVEEEDGEEVDHDEEP
jgi:hypothetical protein